MFDAPSRELLGRLRQAVAPLSPAPILGLAYELTPGLTRVCVSNAHALASFRLQPDDTPGALRGPCSAITATSEPPETGALRWELEFAGARQIWAVQIPDLATDVRFWVGLSDLRRPSQSDEAQLNLAAREAAAGMQALSVRNRTDRLERLDLTAGLLAPLTHALDVREIFEVLSRISQKALPHDLLMIGTFNDALTSLTMWARTGSESDLGGTFKQPYPAAVVRAREFDIIDDRLAHPLERDRPPTKVGCRSAVRVQLRIGDRVVGGLAFNSYMPAAYDADDIVVAQRLGEYVTVAMAHQELAEQARATEVLRSRAASLDLLDELLASRLEGENVRDAFTRISALVQKLIPHDAAWLPVMLPDRSQARIHASVGFDGPVPDLVPIPTRLLDTPEWEHEVVDDMEAPNTPHPAMVARGFLSLLRVPLRFDGRYGGALVMLARAKAAFSSAHVPVARRIADRLAMMLVGDREVAASKRAEEASKRASQLESRVRALTDELDARTGFRRVVGESKEWRGALKQATQVASGGTTVLLLGESGTGKEVVARFVHRASSRAGGPFIALNCAALPEQLLEAELFGYERGAFTGAVQSKPGQLEQASGGTLFLDEVGEMSLPAQAKFLRVLQEREFQRLGGTRVLKTDVRIIAATNRDLPRAIAQNQFREDLYYRLNVFAIELPPLRQRRLDVLPLSDAFLAEIGKGMGRPAAGISRETLDLLVGYHWPGNVRELRNILERASILCEGGLITPDHLPIGLTTPSQVPAVAPARITSNATSAPAVTSAGELQTLEREMIAQALALVRFNKSKAAKNLGLTRQQLYVRMKKYGLE